MCFTTLFEACKASSSNAAGTLSCPGKTKDVNIGYVIPQGEPIREDGAKENEIQVNYPT